MTCKVKGRLRRMKATDLYNSGARFNTSAQLTFDNTLFISLPAISFLCLIRITSSSPSMNLQPDGNSTAINWQLESVGALRIPLDAVTYTLHFPIFPCYLTPLSSTGEKRFVTITKETISCGGVLFHPAHRLRKMSCIIIWVWWLKLKLNCIFLSPPATHILYSSYEKKLK